MTAIYIIYHIDMKLSSIFNDFRNKTHTYYNSTISSDHVFALIRGLLIGMTPYGWLSVNPLFSNATNTYIVAHRPNHP